MMVKDLPVEIQKAVFYYQTQCGNEPNSNIEVYRNVDNGGFFWEQTYEGYNVWYNIKYGRYEQFYKIYPHGFGLPGQISRLPLSTKEALTSFIEELSTITVIDHDKD